MQQRKCHVCIGLAPYNHEDVGERITYGISEATKEIIIGFEKDFNLIPSQMLIALREKTPNIPSLMQLNNYLKTLRKGHRSGNYFWV